MTSDTGPHSSYKLALFAKVRTEKVRICMEREKTASQGLRVRDADEHGQQGHHEPCDHSGHTCTEANWQSNPMELGVNIAEPRKLFMAQHGTTCAFFLKKKKKKKKKLIKKKNTKKHKQTKKKKIN